MSVDPTRLCQIEISVTDMPRALAFYEGAFGWRPVPAEIHEYVVLEVPPDCAFGLALVPGRLSSASAGGVVPYFATETPEQIVSLVEQHGGRRRLGPLSLAGYGTVYQVEDPDGNRLGLYKGRALPQR